MSKRPLELVLNDATPAYRQVLDQLRLLVQTGELKPGDALPGVRVIGAQLGVHHNTVAEAYRTLASEGLLDLSHGRRATVTRCSVPASITAEERADLLLRLRSLVAELRTKGISSKAILKDIQAVLGS